METQVAQRHHIAEPQESRRQPVDILVYLDLHRHAPRLVRDELCVQAVLVTGLRSMSMLTADLNLFLQSLKNPDGTAVWPAYTLSIIPIAGYAIQSTSLRSFSPRRTLPLYRGANVQSPRYGSLLLPRTFPNAMDLSSLHVHCWYPIHDDFDDLERLPRREVLRL